MISKISITLVIQIFFGINNFLMVETKILIIFSRSNSYKYWKRENLDIKI